MAHKDLPWSSDPVQTGCYFAFSHIRPIRFYIHNVYLCYLFHLALNLSVFVPSAENVVYETLLHKTEAALKKTPDHLSPMYWVRVLRQ